MLELEFEESKFDDSQSEHLITETWKQLLARPKHWNQMHAADRPRPDAPSRTKTIFGKALYSIVCFGASIPCHAIWQKQKEEMWTVSKSATFLATESVNSASFKRGANFSQGKVQNYSPIRILRCTFLARKSTKLIANFSATKVASLPSVSVSLPPSLSLSFSLSLSLSLSHTHTHTKRTSRTIKKALTRFLW